MTVEQIRVGFDNFSYIIYCPKRKKTAIVDPGYDASKLLEFISSNTLELEYIIITHYHRDHTSGIQKIKNFISSLRIVASELDGLKLGVKVDIKVTDRDRLELGDVNLDFFFNTGSYSWQYMYNC